MRTLVTCLIVALTAGLVVPAPVAAEVLNTTFPLVGTYASPCTGELIAFTGDLHVLVGQSLDQDGELQVTLHSNFQSILGTGILTGNQYQIPADIGQLMLVGLPPVTMRIENDFRVVGTAGNFIGKFPLTVSLGVGGGVSANVGPLQFVCG